MTPRLAQHVERVLAQCDVFLPSEMEVASFFETPLGDLQQTLAHMRWFAQRGPRIVVFKLGSAGSLLYERDADRAYRLPALPVRVVDVTGAGDSYCGGFVGHFSKHANPLEAAIAGTVSSSFAIQDYGAMHMLAADTAERDRRADLLRSQVSEV
jgi:ribokinase